MWKYEVISKESVKFTWINKVSIYILKNILPLEYCEILDFFPVDKMLILFTFKYFLTTNLISHLLSNSAGFRSIFFFYF